MKYMLLVLFCAVQHLAIAQKGDYLLSHYQPDLLGLDNTNFDIAIDDNGQLNLANRSGLIQYDGRNWQHTPSPVALLSVEVTDDNVIFAGGVNDFGYYDFEDNQFQFISLSKDENLTELFFYILNDDPYIYFLSENSVVRYERTAGETLTISNPVDEFFISIFRMADEVYVQSESHLYKLNGSTLESTKFKLPDFAEVQFARKHPTSGMYLFGSTLNQLYLLREDGSFKSLKVSRKIVSEGYYAYDATWISDRIFAVSTFEAGCLIVDVEQDELIGEINYRSGLPDNEILAIASDNEFGLWMAHEHGLTRVVPDVPIFSYSNYPGISGNLLATSTNDGTTYVATSSGVFYFDQENQYRNNVYYTVERTTPSPPAQPAKEAKTAPKETSKKKGIRKLFSKKKKSAPAEEKDEEQKGFFGRMVDKISDNFSEVKSIKGKPDQDTRYVRRVKRELISTNYLYKQVDGLDSKTRQLMHFQGHFLAVTNSGLYEVTDTVANLVYDESIVYAFASNQHLILATDDHQIKVFELLDDLWFESGSFDTGNEIIVNIFSDHKDRIWVVSTNSLYQFDPVGLGTTDLPFAEIPNQYIDNVRGTVIDDRIYLVNSSGYFYYDEVNGKVVADSLLQEQLGLPVRHLQQSNGVVWVFDGKVWIRIGKDKALNTYRLLGLFPEMTSIDEVEGKLWIVDDNKDFYQFERGEVLDISFKNKMFIRTVRNPEGEVNRAGDIKFNYESNSITFELSRPDYLGISQVQYQYKLNGLMEDWSVWTDNNTADFNYLPPGNYTMVARSRDVFDQIQESEEFVFSVKPPYWQQPWFYSIQIVIFIALVVGSARLNHGETKGNYFLLAEGLTLLTLVLIIEFLQTIAGSYLGFESTPVIDFAVDVGTALMIFPIELLLKKVIKSGAQLDKLKKLMRKGQLDRV